MSDRRDFFISFNSADLTYAAAIDGALRMAGFTTYYHPRDLKPGGNIAIWMDDALMNSAQTLALYSPSYTADRAVYSKAERYATWWQDPGSDQRKLIPVLLAETRLTPLMAPLKRIDVRGKTAPDAAAQVVEHLNAPDEQEQRDIWRRAQPLPAIFHAAYMPNPNFAGRFEALESLHRTLRQGSNAAITAVAGMGGIGKTTLAAEYCHRLGNLYAGVWWIRAEQESVMLQDLANLGTRLKLEQTGNIELDARAGLDHLSSLAAPWLLIYDNAPDADGIANWLPGGSVRCIITSRRSDFDRLARVMRLEEWSVETTADFILTRTARDDAEGAFRLAATLGGLPLAAEQASAFLNLRFGIGFDDYAADIVRLIKAPRQEGAVGDYPDTVYAAFVRSFETLGKMPGGEEALDILRLCSFLAPDGVEIGMLQAGRNLEAYPADFATMIGDKYAREDALSILHLFSLLRHDPQVLVFHRLLLAVIRDWTKEDVRNLWAASAAHLLDGLFPGGVDTGAGDPGTDTSVWAQCSALIPHVIALEVHIPRKLFTSTSLDRLLNQAGVYLNARGDDAGALFMSERSVEIGRQSRPGSRGLAASLSNLGQRYVRAKRLDDAERNYLEALEIERPLFKAGDTSLAITLSNLAAVYARRKEYAKSEEIFKEAGDIVKRLLGERTPLYGTILSNLSYLYFSWSQEPEQFFRADQSFQLGMEAQRLTADVRGMRHPETSTRYNNLGSMRSIMGDLESATHDLEIALAIALSLGMWEHEDAQVAIEGLVDCLDAQGHTVKADRLRDGDVDDLIAVVERIEAEHRAWVAKDPENRHFGPSSPITGATS